MSKITLEPNESGAGTFSIVSPDSNTNRTLTLPDEAGTILSNASTIDSNNLQSDVYKQNNILGTVSESGGAPTGAIIERGSNSNGEFVKYADGTMICWHFISLQGIGPGGAGTNNFASAYQDTWVYPAEFIVVAATRCDGWHVGTITRAVIGGTESGFGASQGGDRTRYYLVADRSWSDSSSNFPTARLFAIGRWY